MISTEDEWTIDSLAALFVSAVRDTTGVDEHMVIVDVLRQLQPTSGR
jgi:hypothetical protein